MRKGLIWSLIWLHIGDTTDTYWLFSGRMCFFIHRRVGRFFLKKGFCVAVVYFFQLIFALLAFLLMCTQIATVIAMWPAMLRRPRSIWWSVIFSTYSRGLKGQSNWIIWFSISTLGFIYNRHIIPSSEQRVLSLLHRVLIKHHYLAARLNWKPQEKPQARSDRPRYIRQGPLPVKLETFS